MKLRSLCAALLTALALYAVPISGAVVATGLAFTSAACAHTPPNLTPEAQAAFKADQVLVRVGELQDAAIALNKTTPPALSDRDAVMVVRFTTLAMKTIHDVPSGWKVTVVNAYTTLKQNLPPASKTQLAAVFDTIDLLLASVN